MSNKYLDARNDYQQNELGDEFLTFSPFDLFGKWLEEASAANIYEPAAMTLATVDSSQQTHARVVLLKSFDQNGMVFFSNYESAKGREIVASNRVSLSFFWPSLERQIRIEGLVEKTSSAESDEYFASRPKESQIGACISRQSQTIASREELDNLVNNALLEFADKPVPRPANWGGYRVKPQRFEFWQGRPSRLHDRLQFVQHATNPNKWLASRLFP